MPAGQQISQDTSSPANGHSTPHDLFALTDEQILEIEPEAQGSATSGELRAANEQITRSAGHPAAEFKQQHKSPVPTIASQAEARSSSSSESQRSPATNQVAQEPPPWLAAQMKDPWTGEEARELWNGVQQAKSEAAAYRAAFANPEDARALKELYPGGVNEARVAAERARVLDDIDRSYFGVAGKSAQEVSTSRAQLAQRMLREDPAAFREMVFVGLRALENSSGVGATVSLRAESRDGSPAADVGVASGGGASPARTTTGASPASDLRTTESQTRGPEHEAHLAAYASFEKAANDDLERSVGSAIDRTLAQALPNATHMANVSGVGAQHAAPLQAKLSAAIRQEVEAALKGDRQFGEQVAQILSGRRLDEETRAQVVRLIGERAQQLVPIAAKRVLSDWTQTTLAAHRGNTTRADGASSRREVAPASTDSRGASLRASTSANSGRDPGRGVNHSPGRSDARRVDYRKLSDDQILEL